MVVSFIHWLERGGIFPWRINRNVARLDFLCAWFDKHRHGNSWQRHTPRHWRLAWPRIKMMLESGV